MIVLRFSFNKNVAVDTGSCTLTSLVSFFEASSSISRTIDKPNEWADLIVPCPSHLGQAIVFDSPSDGRILCLDTSTRPNFDIRVIWILALSCWSISARPSSIFFWFWVKLMSIKSMIISPPISLSFICLAISSAASKLVWKAVSSILSRRVAFAELTSTAVKASVASITIEPPDGRRTSLWKAVSIWLSILRSVNMALVLLNKVSLSRKSGLNNFNWRLISSWDSWVSVIISLISSRK